MIKTFIKQLFTPKSRQAKSATADELSAAGSASGIAGTSREARKKLKARAKKPVLHKAHSYPAKNTASIRVTFPSRRAWSAKL